MGLFDFFKKSKKMIAIPEPDQKEVDWFFTEEAKERFKVCGMNAEEMISIWTSPNGEVLMMGYTARNGNMRRDDLPSTFFADYLRALKTTDMVALATFAAHLAVYDDTYATRTNTLPELLRGGA